MPCGKAVSGQLNGEHSKSARLNGLAYKAGEDFNLLSLAAWCCLSRRNINQLFYNEWCFHYFNSELVMFYYWRFTDKVWLCRPAEE